MPTDTTEQKKAYIKALLEERRGAVTYGRDRRVAAIDAELARLGAGGKPPGKRAATREEKRGDTDRSGA